MMKEQSATEKKDTDKTHDEIVMMKGMTKINNANHNGI